MSSGRRIAVLAAFLALVVALAWRGREPRPAAHVDRALAALRADEVDNRFARARAPRAFEFPRDHGAHPAYQSEWWYFTGHLAAANGREFGFQLTLFRFEIDAGTTPAVSPWQTPRIVLGHFAVSDFAGARFHHFERISRALPVLAGASESPARVWLDDWSIEHDGAVPGTWRIRAAQQGHALDLVLAPEAAPIAQGEHGLSRKSARAGHASYYYSVPRLATQGTLSVAGASHAVTGTAWLDREWSTSALGRDQTGWDWFGLHFDDGSDLMFYRLRRTDGTSDPYSAGSHRAADGTLTRLGVDDVELTPRGSWHSPRSGRSYPARWSLRSARLALELELVPRLAAQEWHGRVHYWEGAVAIKSATGGALLGRGYVEMTGY